jgi:TolB-like protein
MKPKSIFLMFFALILVSLAFTHVSASPTQNRKKVAVLPFTMNADRDLSFLREGIVDMLSSRLAWKDKVQIAEKGAVAREMSRVKPPLNKEKAIQIGKALGVDYVILGSLTVFGNSVSIDAKILDVAKSEELVTAFEQSEGMDTVIPTINKFAQDINAEIMGRTVRRPEVASAPQQEREEGALVKVGEGVGVRQKPKYVHRFKLEITSVDVGDVDGDGRNEIVITDKNTVYIYKWKGNTFFQFKAIKGAWTPYYIYVSVADMDENGRAEIYVSNLLSATVSSLVLEWDGNRFATIAEGQPWLFRATEVAGKGRTLLGQKRVTSGGYMGDVQTLKRHKGGFVSEGTFKLPRFGNVFNFIIADLGGKEGISTILLDPYERIRIYNKKGDQVWRSDEYFGGALTYMEDMGRGHSRESKTGKRLFIPSPIYRIDIDQDGKEEVVICQNYSTSRRVSEDLRWFSSGKVVFLEWDGAGLLPRWTSQKLSGAVVGYKIADMDQDGSRELFIASVTSESYFVGIPESRLVVYDLKQ